MFTFRSGPHVGLEFEKVKKVIPYLFLLQTSTDRVYATRIDQTKGLLAAWCNPVCPWQVYFGSYFVCDSTISTASNSKPHVIDVGDNLNVITIKHDDVSVNHASPKSGSLESNMDLCGPRPVELMYWSKSFRGMTVQTRNYSGLKNFRVSHHPK